MKQLFIVIAASIAIAAFLLLHKYGGSLAVGIVVGGYYFLKAVISGGGIAEVRITHTPGTPRKVGDPAGSIGMGLAASGIAAGSMGSSDYTQALGAFLPIAVILGILIALGYAILPMVKKTQQASPQEKRSDPDNEVVETTVSEKESG
jgi:hypothetical protein